MFKAARTLISGSILGKVIGTVRELLLAAFFGTSFQMDAYRAALTATLIPTNFFMSDSLNAGFIPLYNHYLQEDSNKASSFFWLLSGLLTAIAILLTVFLSLFADISMRLLAPGFSGATFQLASQFLQIFALGVPFYVQSFLFSYLQMGHRGYSLTSLRSSLQSVGLIIGTLIAFWLKEPLFLAWGFTGAYILYALISGIFLWHSKLLVWPNDWNWQVNRLIIGQFWKTMKPLILLPIFLQGTLGLERAIASLIGPGTVAAFDYVSTITDTGMVLIAVPLSLVGLSEFSRMSFDAVRERLSKILPLLLMAGIPISTFLIFNSEKIVRFLYKRGAFDETSVHITSAILLGSALGLWAEIIGVVLIKALNAQFRNRQSMIYMAIALGTRAIIEIATYRFLGALALGIGDGIYGIVLFILCIRAFHLTENVLRYVAVLLVGIVIYAALSIIPAGDNIAGLAQITSVFLLFWLVYVLLVPSLRQVFRKLIATSLKAF